MSLIDDYTIHVLHDQRHSELMARAAEERLARGVLADQAPWWGRLVPRSVRTTRSVPSGMRVHRHRVAH